MRQVCGAPGAGYLALILDVSGEGGGGDAAGEGVGAQEHGAHGAFGCGREELGQGEGLAEGIGLKGLLDEPVGSGGAEGDAVFALTGVADDQHVAVFGSDGSGADRHDGLDAIEPRHGTVDNGGAESTFAQGLEQFGAIGDEHGLDTPAAQVQLQEAAGHGIIVGHNHRKEVRGRFVLGGGHGDQGFVWVME